MEKGKCAGCGAERPMDELKEGKIIFMNIKPAVGKKRFKKFVDEKINLYCVDKPCHDHDQMAHEG